MSHNYTSAYAVEMEGMLLLLKVQEVTGLPPRATG